MDYRPDTYPIAGAIPAAERLIFALDVPTAAAARKLVDLLGDSVRFYKVGLQLLMSGGYFELLDWLADRDKKIFADLKLHDIPETVRLAVKQLASRRITFVTVHADAAALAAAVQVKGDLKILAVTVLTSLDQADLDADLRVHCPLEELVLARAKRAHGLGCDGVISSGQDARALRREVGAGFHIVTPGIRSQDNCPQDDQKRVASVRAAFENGADYIVAGRLIRDADDPREKAAEIQREIAALFSA